MLNTSVVLGPTVGMTMRGMRGTSGSAFSLCRSMSNVATVSGSSSASSCQSSYFFPIMGVFNKQRVDYQWDETDKGGESSGTAGGTPHQWQSGKGGIVSSGRKTPTSRGVRAGDGHNAILISDQQQQQRLGGGGPTRMMEVESSRAMVEDYVRHCLEKADIPWRNGQVDVTPNATQSAMRSLGDHMEESVGARMDSMIDTLQFTPEGGQAQLTTTMRELFADGEINWGRIAVLVKFAGKLSVHCARSPSTEHLVRSIVDWVVSYIDTDLKTWVAENNGWAGFVKFHEDKKQSGFSSLKKLLTVSAAAAGLLTIASAFFRS